MQLPDPDLARKIEALFGAGRDVIECQEGMGIMYDTFAQLQRIKTEYLEIQQRMLDHSASCPQCVNYGIVLKQLVNGIVDGLA